jgi:hypothetical protein
MYEAWLFSKVNPPQNLDFGLLEELSLCRGIQRQEFHYRTTSLKDRAKARISRRPRVANTDRQKPCKTSVYPPTTRPHLFYPAPKISSGHSEPVDLGRRKQGTRSEPFIFLTACLSKLSISVLPRVALLSRLATCQTRPSPTTQRLCSSKSASS